MMKMVVQKIQWKFAVMEPISVMAGHAKKRMSFLITSIKETCTQRLKFQARDQFQSYSGVTEMTRFRLHHQGREIMPTTVACKRIRVPAARANYAINVTAVRKLFSYFTSGASAPYSGC